MPDKSQRTEQPTAKHRKEVREEGRVARSPELASWASLLVISSLLPKLGGMAANRVSAFTQQMAQDMAHPDASAALALLGHGLATAAFAALPIVAVCTGIGIVSSLAQVGLRFTPKALRPQFSRISPRTGVQRIASSQGAWSLVKTLVKLVVMTGVGYLTMHQLFGAVLGGPTLPLPVTIAAAGGTIVSLIRDVGVIAFVVAGADYAFQRRQYQQTLRMSKQEIRDERRNEDGAPEIRRAIRTKARRLSRMRMMAAVATADVVVTNPTHYAVAVTYDRANDRAPRVVAKGADALAARIRQRATEHGVPIVEHPELARALHASCEVDDVIPAALYTAVARLLAFVYSLSPTAKALRDVHRMSTPSARLRPVA